MQDAERYLGFVEHPRYGRGPRLTGLNPRVDLEGTFLHWHSPDSCRVPGTAVVADLQKQVPATVPVTHYFDVERRCRDCGRMFLFFAEEQRFWYEELRFRLESDCVRCVPCRKRRQGISRISEQYESLFHRRDRTAEESLTMAECCLELMEHGLFADRQSQHLHALLNLVGEDVRYSERMDRIRARIRLIEAAVGGQVD